MQRYEKFTYQRKEKKEITSVIQWREILMVDIEYDNKYTLLK